jgi:hypothetical protein
MERPERLVLLLVATLIGAPAIRIALWILTVLGAWTALQRMQHVWKETQSS